MGSVCPGSVFHILSLLVRRAPCICVGSSCGSARATDETAEAKTRTLTVGTYCWRKGRWKCGALGNCVYCRLVLAVAAGVVAVPTAMVRGMVGVGVGVVVGVGVGVLSIAPMARRAVGLLAPALVWKTPTDRLTSPVSLGSPPVLNSSMTTSRTTTSLAG